MSIKINTNYKYFLIFLVYTCYGSWQEGSRHMVVAAPISTRSQTRPHALCFIYTTYVKNGNSVFLSQLIIEVFKIQLDVCVIISIILELTRYILSAIFIL